MTVLFTDDFNRADGAVGANYTDLGATANVISNEYSLASLASGGTGAYWNGGTPPADAYFKVTLKTINTNPEYQSIALRFDTATFNGYAFVWDTTGASLQRITGGVGTQLVSTGTPPSANDVILFSVVGSALTATLNGAAYLSTTDGTYTAAGRAFISGYGIAGRLDNLEIGSVDSAAQNYFTLLGVG